MPRLPNQNSIQKNVNRKHSITLLSSNAEIRKVLDIIMRMFHDSHPKVLASFFDVLADLVQAHHQDMMDLLPSIFSRLFSKAVSDVLGNLHDKISRTLDAIRFVIGCRRLFTLLVIGPN